VAYNSLNTFNGRTLSSIPDLETYCNRRETKVDFLNKAEAKDNCPAPVNRA
jgi:hypothetical protein